MSRQDYLAEDSTEGFQRPCFCRRCNRSVAVVAGSNLCIECGDILISQGYCCICERYWPMSSGEVCPKHEVVLAGVAPAPVTIVGAAGLGVRRWVTVRTFADLTAAQASRIRLDAEGIPTLLEGERMGSASMYQVATGGVKLQVPEPLLADARIILAQSWSLPVDSEDDLDDVWDDLAVDPMAWSRDLGRIVILIAMAAPLLATILLYLIQGHR